MNFAFQNGVGLDNKNNLKQLIKLKTANTNSAWAYIREGLLSERYLGLRIGGGGVLIFGILRYS